MVAFDAQALERSTKREVESYTMIVQLVERMIAVALAFFAVQLGALHRMLSRWVFPHDPIESHKAERASARCNGSCELSKVGIEPRTNRMGRTGVRFSSLPRIYPNETPLRVVMVVHRASSWESNHRHLVGRSHGAQG